MIDLRIVSLSSLVIIFVSVFFIHYAFNNFITVTEYCAVKGGDFCLPTNLFLLFFFSFSFVVSFIVVIETTIYFMFKGVEIVAKMTEKREKKLKNSMESLEKRIFEIENAKREIHKKYLNRRIEHETYKKMKEKYEGQILDIEMQINEMKKKMMKVW
jgi:ABC-type multidrug transport system fused ATPase/permease subunit